MKAEAFFIRMKRPSLNKQEEQQVSPKEDFSQKRHILPNQLHHNVYCNLKIYFSDLNRALKYMNRIIFGKIKFS
jgi:hypothetical protein